MPPPSGYVPHASVPSYGMCTTVDSPGASAGESAMSTMRAGE